VHGLFGGKEGEYVGKNCISQTTNSINVIIHLDAEPTEFIHILLFVEIFVQTPFKHERI
jgi:hypothetical protein